MPRETSLLINIPEGLLLGAHTSTNGGVASAVHLADKLGFTAIQIFTKNNNRWFANNFKDSEIDLFKERIANSTVKFVVSHDSYLINLCAVDPEILIKSRDAFKDEIIRCNQLGIGSLNFHPGSHLGRGEENGLELICESILTVLSELPGNMVSLMLELTAGQGTALGYKFEHLSFIINRLEKYTPVSVCIDTAHAFAAGYNIKNSKKYDDVIKEFDDKIGLNFLRCIHLNDSKKDLGSRVDRHTNIGEGFIGLDGFTNIMNDERLRHIPKILETPKGKEHLEDIDNLNRLISLIQT